MTQAARGVSEGPRFGGAFCVLALGDVIALYPCLCMILMLLPAPEGSVGFRFRRSFQLLPGFRFGVTGKGASLRVGPRGLGYTVNSKGQQTISASLPGTGLGWSERLEGKATRTRRRIKAASTENSAASVLASLEADESDFSFLDYPAPPPPRISVARRLGRLVLWGFAAFGAFCALALVLR